MVRLNFDTERLPPFLVGYLIDGKVGEREIIATILDLAIRGDVSYRREGDSCYFKKTGNRPKNRFERIILDAFPEEETKADELMGSLRGHAEDIYAGFREHLKDFHSSITSQQKSFFMISFSFKVQGRKLHEMSRTYGEDKLLPYLKEKDQRALLDLERFLREHPVDPERIAAGYVPYAVAMGLNDYWMQQFKADPWQRHVVEDFFPTSNYLDLEAQGWPR